MARENPKDEKAEYRQHVGIEVPVRQAEVEIEAGSDGSDAVNGNRRPATEPVGEVAKAEIAENAADSPQLRTPAKRLDSLWASDAACLNHVRLHRRQPDHAGPDRKQGADAEQQADRGCEDMAAAEQLQHANAQLRPVPIARCTRLSDRGALDLQPREILGLIHVEADEE